MCITFAGHIILFPVNTVATSCNGSPAGTGASRKGVTRARRYFITNPLISMRVFSFHSIFFYGNYHTTDSSLKHLLVMGVYARVYPGHTSKKIIVICKFVTFSLLRLGLNTEYCIYSKQLATIAKMLFLLLFCQEKRENGQHRRWTDKEKLMEARLIIKTGNYL